MPVLPSEVVEGFLAPAAFEGVVTPSAIKGAPTAVSGDVAPAVFKGASASSDCVVEVDAFGSDLSVTTEVVAFKVANSFCCSMRTWKRASRSTSVEGRISFATWTDKELPLPR